MGFLARIAEHRGTWSPAYNLKDPALREFWGGASSTSGQVVTEFTALMCAAFFDGVQQISADVAKLPLNLHKALREGGSDLFVQSPLYKLMKYSPNPETRSMIFRRTITMHALIHGNGYAEIVRDQRGNIASLWVLHPSQVKPFHDTREGRDGRRNPLRYLIDGQAVLEPEQILHIRGLTDDAVSGMSLVSVAREALGLCLASQKFAAAFFGNGTRFGGILSSEDQDISPEQAEQIRTRVEALHSSADKAFKLLVLGMGFKFTETGSKPNEAQMKEIRDQQVAEVARYLNMPLHKLKLNTPGAVSYNSVEMADLDYYKGCLLNWIVGWEEELSAKLIPTREVGNQFFKHNTNAFLRGDIKSRYDAMGVARDKGIISANEWRKLEDMNPQTGSQGDLYLVQSAQVPLNKLEELTDAQITNTLTPAPAPVALGSDEEDDARAEMAARLAAAEREAATLLDAERTVRAELEASIVSGTATADELGRLRVELYERDAALTAKNAECARIAAEVEAFETEQARLAALADAQATQLADSQAELGQARADLQAKAAVIEDFDASMKAVEAAHRDAQAQADATTTELAEQIRTYADQVGDLEAAVTRAGEVSDSLTAELAAAQVEVATAREAYEATLKTTLDESAEVERERDDLREALAAAEARAEALTEDVALARTDLEKVQLERDDLTRLSQEHADTLKSEVEAIKESSVRTIHSEQRQARTQEIERLTAALTAHRALVEDVMGRLVAREVDRAKSRQQSPAKLRGWVSTFYETFEPLMVDALTPVVRVHLAWNGDSLAAASELSEQIAKAYVQESRETITRMLNAEPDDLHVALVHLLNRWERERPAAVADALLAESIQYIRQLEAGIHD